MKQPAPIRQLPIALLALVMVAVLTAALWQVTGRTGTKPDIQGIYIGNPARFPAFSLTDHNNQAFGRSDLLGSWHFVSYGYTYCPDICPITLATLAQVVDRLQREKDHQELAVLFYSVDQARDTVERLAEYMPYFHKDFIGLTVSGRSGENAEPFERHLNIVYEVEDPLEQDTYGSDAGAHYLVNHGILLYLLNPEGRLQAIFQPEISSGGIYYFSADQLYQDYLAIALQN